MLKELRINSFDTLLLNFLMVLGVDLKPYLIQTLRLTLKSSPKTSSQSICIETFKEQCIDMEAMQL